MHAIWSKRMMFLLFAAVAAAAIPALPLRAAAETAVPAPYAAARTVAVAGTVEDGSSPGADDPDEAIAGASEWAKPELRLAIAAGLTTPAALDLFAQPISRERFAGLAVRLYEALTGGADDGATVSGSPDAGAEPSEAADANSPASPFEDTISPDAIRAWRLGIVQGVEAHLFAPNAAITRQELAVMLSRAIRAARPDAPLSSRAADAFADEDEIGGWAKEAVRSAVLLGVLKGDEDGRIDPLGLTTQEQAVVTVYRAFAALRPLQAGVVQETE
ncbi:S-layer homology domain-containing protein [Cohnella sp. REN36]|uniref:S-layer homology domain-containing protein n=1 Tax=Cohnella sp. REN36 TaxID=2887347 RepID=UPI001D1410D8|nr:S-layer homology domain-containing protein [Cohnella sp. REN36]MCC3375595.1 S-layer homology domain-containing protein [Cohnella sp. REN36]